MCLLHIFKKYEYNYTTLDLYIRNFEATKNINLEINYRASYPEQITGAAIRAYDYYNPEHLNVIGSRKLTYFLGKYLTENYDIKGSHSDKTVKRWDLCAQKTDKVLEECAKDTKNKIGAQYFELSAYSK